MGLRNSQVQHTALMRLACKAANSPRAITLHTCNAYKGKGGMIGIQLSPAGQGREERVPVMEGPGCAAMPWDGADISTSNCFLVPFFFVRRGLVGRMIGRGPGLAMLEGRPRLGLAGGCLCHPGWASPLQRHAQADVMSDQGAQEGLAGGGVGGPGERQGRVRGRQRGQGRGRGREGQQGERGTGQKEERGRVWEGEEKQREGGRGRGRRSKGRKGGKGGEGQELLIWLPGFLRIFNQRTGK